MKGLVSHSYSVGGFCFTAEGMPFEPDNLAPFRTDPVRDPVFTLKVVSKLPDSPANLLYRTDSDPEEPEIAIYTRADGYLIETRPLPDKPLACRMTVDADFRRAQMSMSGTSDAFAINNSLMLLYAFSTANLGAVLMHASAVVHGGKGYLFLGKSGTGKSTHSRLWIENIPDTELINDDNPVLRLSGDKAIVYGSPWSGKTPCYKAVSFPAAAIVRLSQAPANHIGRLPLVQAYASLMASSSGFRPFKSLSDGWHNTLERLASTLPCYHLECLPDAGAALLCYNTVNG